MKTTVRNLPAPGLAGAALFILPNPQPAAPLRIPFIGVEKKNYMKLNTSLLYRWITALFLLALPAVVHAQFTLTTNYNLITITAYTGPGGAVVIPAEINGYAVTDIGGYAFAYSTNLTSITIPGSVTNVGNFAFEACGLTSVSISNGVITIGEGAFEYCSDLTSITIPGSVTNIGDDAFADCTNLTSAYFEGNAPPDDGTVFSGDPDAVVYYEAGTTGWGPTFGGAPTEETTPASDFGYQVYDGSITITGYYGPRGPIVIPSVINGYTVTGIAGNGPNSMFARATSVTMPNTVTSIGEYAFFNCQSLTNVIIGDGVTSIGQSAFANCSSLTAVTIPNSVTNIGGDAFIFCSRLPNIVIPGSVSSIGADAFFHCGSLTDISVDATNPFYSSLNGVLFDKAPDTLIEYPSGLTGPYAIPNNVTNFGQAFSACSGLTDLVIPGSVTSSIDGGAFYACTSLTNISVDSANPSYSSLNGVLLDKAQDTIIDYPPGSSSPYTIPNSVTSIGAESFEYCNLTSVIIPGNVTNIEGNAFYGCGGLTNASIAYGVTSIGTEAFERCGLTSITIPGSVTSIGDYAFEDSQVTSAYFLGNAPPDDGTVFWGSADSAAVVYYLPGTTGWGPTFGGAPTELWNPQATAFTTAGSQVGFSITDQCHHRGGSLHEPG
jgi:BspA type Leucine rich repeat region (6 copies)